MSHLDDLYKEAGIGSNPNKPRQKGKLVSLLIFAAVFGVISYSLYSSGSLGSNQNRLYFILVAVSLLLTFLIRLFIKRNKSK
jgi:hypothetical protein